LWSEAPDRVAHTPPTKSSEPCEEIEDDADKVRTQQPGLTHVSKKGQKGIGKKHESEVKENPFSAQHHEGNTNCKRPAAT